MGVVYQAQDSKLERTVALKFLAAHLLKDDEARQRFHREAKAAAALSHPNICRVHEIDEAQGRTFIAMEFVEGEDLDKRIEQGPLKIPEALDIALQIARGLEAAHEKKIVHRDIKPGNVIVDDKGHVTVMDFGLALLTESSKLTQLDTTVGTVAYMSPEQAQGVEVDRRTDIWALGCVLYEMVCGQRPFKGLYDKALLYEIVHEEYEPLTAVRAGVPMELEWLVGKCLKKAEPERYQHTEDVIVDLTSLSKKLESGTSTVAEAPKSLLRSAPGASPGGPPQQSAVTAASSEGLVLRWRLRIFQVLFAVVTVVALVLGALAIRPEPSQAPLRKFSFAPGPLGDRLVIDLRAVISPDGRQIVYAAGGEPTKLWIRDLDSEEPRALDGTEGAHAPFWSPDSQFIGFVTGGLGAAGGELKKVSVRGGAASTVCQLTGNYAGGAWSPDGESIVFSSGIVRRLYEVPSRGGSPRLLVEPEGTAQGDHFWTPHFLPLEAGKRVLLFTIGAVFESEIVVEDLETGARTVLARGGTPVYSPSGHILYQTGLATAGLWALPFSIAALEATGEAFPIGDEASEPSVAADGTLVYIRDEGQQQLVWRDREGGKIGAIGQPQQGLQYPSLSPDGRYIAARGYEKGIPESDIWIFDLARSTRMRLTFDPDHDSRPIWSPTGNEIAFASFREGKSYGIFVRPADGGGAAEALTATPLWEGPGDWSADGQFLLYDLDHPERGDDIWYLKRKSDGEGFDEVPFLQTPFNEQNPKLSPDGNFVAYQSDESGRFEVYVRPFPEGDGKWPVSRSGGEDPRWSRDGKELFYVEGDTLVAVAVETTPGFSAGEASRLFFGLVSAARQLSELRCITRRPALCDGGKRGECHPRNPRGRELVRRVPRPRAGVTTRTPRDG